jgi:hypothetical protein
VRLVLACVAGCWLFASEPAQAVAVDRIEISHEGRTYSVHFDVLIAADTTKARALLTDYRHWPRISAAINESRLLTTYSDGRQRVSVTFSTCVLLVFCRTLRQVKDMETGSARSRYRTDLVPGEGDFASGTEVWEILPDAARTRLRYRATLVLGFDVPPLIGPWLLKRELHAELLRTAAGVEALARD